MISRFLGTMLGQILAIIACSSAITFVLFLALLSSLGPGGPPHHPGTGGPGAPPPPGPWASTDRLPVGIARFRAGLESEEAVIFATQGAAGQIRLAPAPCAALGADRPGPKDDQAADPHVPSRDVTVAPCDAAEPDLARRMQIVGRMIDHGPVFRTGPPGPSFLLTFPFVGAVLFLCVAVSAMSAWAVSRVIGPLHRLSEKADAFGRDIAVAPIEEEGPLEIRRAARAFNHMQERIAGSIRDRTRMLAAISHDLRTPLTRMRLIVETGPSNDIQDKLLQNVSLMQSMITSALAFLSGNFDQEEKEWLDLGALLLTLRDEFEEAGSVVQYTGPEQMECFCRPNAIERAFTNLIENGCHFGTEVVIRASVAGDRIVVDVEDDGPGIPKHRRREVIEPFVRLDPSRSNHRGSVGLGLSIVQEIVSAHKGTLTLLDREPHGLIARIELPATGPRKPGAETIIPPSSGLPSPTPAVARPPGR
jgi:signal transduction histidine kinase